MADDFILGMDAKIYQGAADADVADLTEMDNVSDVTLTLTAGEADVTTRANDGWRATAPTLRECTVEFQMLWQPGDTCFEAIKTAWLANDPVCLAVLTGDRDVADSEGPVGNFSITNFTRTEALEEGVKVAVTAKLATFAEWYDGPGT